jgi:CheY-like chemotaxis protein
MSKSSNSILLVDDDPDDREALREALRMAGSDHEIIEAHDGEEALNLLREMKDSDTLPSLIVLDINMPRVDGKQALVAIQSDPNLSALPVVVLSTSTSPLDKMFFAQRRIEMITKPFTLGTLNDVASRLLSYCRDVET